MRDMRRFFKANPQVLVLLLICLVLGIGTFVAVLFGIVTAKSNTTSGDPSGSLVTPQAAQPYATHRRPGSDVLARVWLD